jgi:Secretion system C-terminal sorting domain
MKKSAYLFIFLFLASFSNCFSQCAGVNELVVNVEVLGGSTTTIFPGKTINILYTTSGCSPNCNNFQSGAQVALEFEIFDIVNPSTPIFSTSSFSEGWVGCNPGNLSGWAGGSAAAFTLPCNLNLNTSATYEIQCKILSIFPLLGDPQASFNIEFWSSLSPRGSGLNCVYNFSSSYTCSFKIADAIATSEPLGVTIFGGSCGTAAANPIGGFPPYTYQWNDPLLQTTQTAINLTASNYTVTVTDAIGCISTASIFAGVPYTHPNGITISSSASWTGVNFKINGPVVVENGATLTIDGGSVIEFGPQGIIRNASAPSGGSFNPSDNPLIVNNATLTGLSGCPDNRWKGINVTGEVELTNATIENADNALQLHGRFDLGNGTFIQSGKLTANNCSFTNNQRGITIFNDVQFPVTISASNFQNVVTPLIPSSFTNPVTFITMRANAGFVVNGNNTFSNDNAVFNFPNKPIAIDYFPTGTLGGGPTIPLIANNTFTNLQEGIIARNSRFLAIQTNSFVNTDRGITLIGSLLGEISTNNTFTIADATNIGNDTYGIFLQGTNGTTVRDNLFTGTGGNSAQSYGVVVENTGTGGSTLFSNSFEGTDIAVQTQGNNPAFKIRCNNFENNGVPHNIAAWTTLVLGGTNSLFKQGLNCSTPNGINEDQAGNEWLTNCGAGLNDLVVDPSIILLYKAHEFNVGLTPTTDPQCSSPAWLLLTSAQGLDVCTGVNKTITSCNDPFAGIVADPDVQFEAYVVEVRSLMITYKNEIATLQSNIDGGNTQTLLTTISTQSGGNVKNTLLAASPLLSDEVLIAYCNANPPTGHLKQVILANSPVSQAVMDVLNNMNIPNGIRNQINNAQTGVSGRQILEQNINGFVGEIQLLANDLQRRFNQIQDKPREKQLLVEMNTVESQKRLSQILLAEGDVTGSQAIITTMDTDPFINNVNENVQFCKLMNCLIGMTTQNRSITQLTTPEVQIVSDVANSPTKIANTAQAIMEVATGQTFFHPIVKIPTGSNLRKGSTSSPLTSTQSPSLKLYPNPSKGYFNVQYDNELYKNLSVEIYNMLGEKITTTTISNKEMDLSLLENGVYFINFIDADNQLIDNQKLIIQK